MTNPLSNLVLIGMPGAGKSTVGVLLAKETSRSFTDTDLLIQTAQGRPLQHIVDTDGYLALRRIEEDILLDLSLRDHVIATGGSAVYSERAMTHLKSHGLLVFLDVTLDTLGRRVRNFGTRGLARRPDQSFAELFEERFALYTRHADITVTCDHLTQEEVCDRIIEQVRSEKQNK
ncbi:shikimate kinase [Geobacter sp. SVR]|uniref:shikimate kinase n=1 Tax=Geobacter sp. SVR TaxID=2495594 RepID=UPI00143F0049|nr:shikimate kinase [Geobacter sp. SVR]BCS54585.1 shikimate kinase [Geobacter sp. SVR]GCF86908.1 shikimate kinase [Geobacter sp. SVR]